MTKFMGCNVSELEDTHRLCRVPAGATFTRASTAITAYGDTVQLNQPRFTHLFPETTVTNALNGTQSDGGDTNNPEMFTLNQQTGTDTLGDTTGFETKKGTETITSSIEEAYSGSRSLKVVTPGSVTLEGVGTPSQTALNATIYIFGLMIKASAGATLTASLYNGGGGTMLGQTSIVGTGSWEYIEVFGTTVDTTIKTMVRTSGAQAITFYVDQCRLAKTDTTGFTGRTGTETLSISPYTSYQGLRSVKCIAQGTNIGEGIRIAQSVAVGGTYTLTAKLKAPSGEQIDVQLYTSGGGVTTNTFTGTGNWQNVNASVTSTSTTVYIQIMTHSTQAITFYVDYYMLEIGSTAHNWAYGGSSYTINYVQHQGLMVEEATSNLFSENVSTCGDTLGDTTGFSGRKGTESKSISTVEYFQGSKCLKITTPGDVVGEGVYNSVASTSGQTYTFSARVKFPKGVPFYLVLNTTSYFTGTGDWQYVYITGTASSSSILAYILTASFNQNITFYTDTWQLEQKAYPTSWILGQTSRSAETMTAPSSILNIDTNGYSNLLTENQSNVETDLTGLSAMRGSLVRDTVEFYEGTASAKSVASGTGNHYIDSGYITVVGGVTYCASLYSKVVGTGDVKIQLYWYDASYGLLGHTDSTTSTSSEWTKLTVTGTAPTGTTYVRFLLNNASGVLDTTIWWDEAQLSATSSVKPWILGGTQSNTGAGTIEFEFYGTIKQLTTTSGLFGWSVGGTGSLGSGIWMYSGLALRINGSGGSVSTGMYPSVNTKYKVTVTFDSISLKIYVDGILKTTTTNYTLPIVLSTLYIGSYSTSSQFNGLIRNVVVSSIPRTDEDIAARAADEEGFPVDQYVTGILPLQHDLEIFRAVTK